MAVARKLVCAGLGFAALALAGCDPGAPAPSMEEAASEPELSPATFATPDAAPAFPAASCSDIATLAAAMTEQKPFASLLAGAAQPNDGALRDIRTTSLSPAGGACRIGTTDGPAAGRPVALVACSLFASGVEDRTRNAERAKTLFDAARAELERCLPEDWSFRDGSQLDPDSTEVMIYESQEDARRAMDDTFYVYPVQLRKEWAETATAFQKPGWNITLNFQADRGARASGAQ